MNTVRCESRVAAIRRIRRFARYRGLLVLVLWQAAPVAVDDRGRTRIGFGVGGGQLEYALLGCDGSVLESQGVTYRHAAIEGEHWIANNVRVHAAGGYQWTDSLSARGPFGTFLFSYEGQKFGIGGGVGFIPRVEYDYQAPNNTVPSGMLRFGSRDRTHFRVEVFPPAAHSYTEFARMVVGFNQFSMTTTSGSIGVGSVGVLDAEPTVAVVGDIFRPISRNMLFGVRGYASPGHENSQVGLTAAVKIGLR